MNYVKKSFARGILAKQNSDILGDQIPMEDYLVYMRRDTLSGKTKDTAFLKGREFKQVSNYLDSVNLKYDQSNGRNSFWSMVVMSSNNQRELMDSLDFDLMEVYAQYSSAWEFSYEPTLRIDDQDINIFFGFMHKTQADEVNPEGPLFNTIRFEIITDAGVIFYYAIKKSIL